MICCNFLQPSPVTTCPDPSCPSCPCGGKKFSQFNWDMRGPLPRYTDTLTDTIFRSWPGPGYVSGDRIVSGAFCHPQRHATRSQLHLKWTRTIYQCLMDRVFKNWMNTGSRNMPKLTIVVLLLTDNILHKNLSDIEFLRNQMQNEWLARWLSGWSGVICDMRR